MRDFLPKDHSLDGASIFVTGGTGSFGKQFVRHVVEHHAPRRLVIFSRDELKQYEMQQEFDVDRYPFLRYFIGDVRDYDRLQLAMRDIDFVIHAAALKQVPAAEYNPFECIKTNVHGAENIVRASMDNGVQRVVALSTDKAANPINLYGASKLASDKIFISANNISGANGPRFAVVRYGNVANSRGSVMPLFKRMRDEGVTELPITDPRMTRFWITLDQGVAFVLSSLQRMIGGELFVPKIPSMRITDLAEALVPDATFKEIGIRPGEKLHEIMVPREDGRLTLDLGDRYVIEPHFQFWNREEYRERYGGEPVDPDFEYASDTNTEWLTADQLRAIAG